MKKKSDLKRAPHDLRVLSLAMREQGVKSWCYVDTPNARACVQLADGSQIQLEIPRAVFELWWATHGGDS